MPATSSQRIPNNAEVKATQKGACNTNMAAAIDGRDTGNAHIVAAMATVSKLIRLHGKIEFDEMARVNTHQATIDVMDL